MCIIDSHYGEQIGLGGGISFRFVEVGHLLGSASVEVGVEENNVRKKLVFSGDIGNTDQPLIRDPGYIDEADYVVMESTYGSRSHGERPDYVGQLSAIIPVSYTHLDVYKRQVLALPQRRLQARAGFRAAPLPGGSEGLNDPAIKMTVSIGSLGPLFAGESSKKDGSP